MANFWRYVRSGRGGGAAVRLAQKTRNVLPILLSLLSLSVSQWLPGPTGGSGFFAPAVAEELGRRKLAADPEAAKAQVCSIPGLVAFWEFGHTADGTWTSHFDPRVVDRGFPLYLRRIDDPRSYRPGGVALRGRGIKVDVHRHRAVRQGHAL